MIHNVIKFPVGTVFIDSDTKTEFEVIDAKQSRISLNVLYTFQYSVNWTVTITGTKLDRHIQAGEMVEKQMTV